MELDDTNKPKILIIGAGASGIAAATRLYENGLSNFLILEAENRIGGRIYTTQFENCTVDLGAQFCHGKHGNIVYEMVEHLNLLKSELGKRLYTPFHSSRKKLDPKLFDELIDMFEGFFYEEKENYPNSFGDYMLKRTNEVILEKYGNDANMYTFATEALNTYKLDLIANEGSFSWFDVAADEDYEECDGDKLFGWNGRGYKTVLDVLLKKYPNPTQEIPVLSKILLSKQVTKISWQGKYVTVSCNDEIYKANHIIFTPSLGVLKEQHGTLFEPCLPPEKIDAIATIGIGSNIKVIYYFPVRWWPNDFHDFTFVWSEEDRKIVADEFPEAVLTNGRSWLPSVLQLVQISNSTNLLGAWICGENVPEVELLSDEKIISGTMFLCNKFLGHLFSNICRPKKIIRENWYANKNFRGVYSYQTIQSRSISSDSQEIVLSKPLCSDDGIPRVLFAGEATSPTHYGTVHGAIETGWREADRLIELFM